MKENPPITPDEIRLLESCRTDADWHAACDRITGTRGRFYPPDWYAKVISSGLMRRKVGHIPRSIPNDVDGRDMRNDKTIPF